MLQCANETKFLCTLKKERSSLENLLPLAHAVQDVSMRISTGF